MGSNNKSDASLFVPLRKSQSSNRPDRQRIDYPKMNLNNYITDPAAWSQPPEEERLISPKEVAILLVNFGMLRQESDEENNSRRRHPKL